MLDSGTTAKAEFKEDLPRFMHNVLQAFNTVSASIPAAVEICSPTANEDGIDPDPVQPDASGDTHLNDDEDSDSDDKDSQPKKKSIMRGLVTEKLMAWRSKCFNLFFRFIFVKYFALEDIGAGNKRVQRRQNFNWKFFPKTAISEQLRLIWTGSEIWGIPGFGWEPNDVSQKSWEGINKAICAKKIFLELWTKGMCCRLSIYILLTFFPAEKALHPKSEAYQKIPLIVSSDRLEVYVNIGRANEYIPPPRKNKKLAKLKKDNEETIREVKQILMKGSNDDGDSFARYKIVPHDSQAVGNVLYRCVDDDEYPAIAMINNSHIQNTQKSVSNVNVSSFSLV